MLAMTFSATVSNCSYSLVTSVTRCWVTEWSRMPSLKDGLPSWQCHEQNCCCRAGGPGLQPAQLSWVGRWRRAHCSV